jgi:hypothetical protein
MAGTMVNAMHTAAKMHKNPVFVNHNFPQESYAVSVREIISNFHDLFDYSGGYSTQIPGEPIILFVKVLFLVQMCVGLVDFWICFILVILVFGNCAVYCWRKFRIVELLTEVWYPESLLTWVLTVFFSSDFTCLDSLIF